MRISRKLIVIPIAAAPLMFLGYGIASASSGADAPLTPDQAREANTFLVESVADCMAAQGVMAQRLDDGGLSFTADISGDEGQRLLLDCAAAAQSGALELYGPPRESTSG